MIFRKTSVVCRVIAYYLFEKLHESNARFSSPPPKKICIAMCSRMFSYHLAPCAMSQSLFALYTCQV